MNPETLPSDSNPAPSPAASPVKKKGSSRSFLEDLFVTASGCATSAAVVYGSDYLARRFDVSIYTWMANFILPVGAIGCGFVAATGYWIGALWFNHRPTRWLLLNIVLVSLTTYFSIHQLNYSHEVTRGGVPLSSVMSFPEYLVRVTENMVYKSDRSYEKEVVLGKWGWGVAALQVVGFCLGGFLVYGILTAIPFCDRCAMYFKKLWGRTSNWKDLPAMGVAYETVAGLLAGGQLQAAADEHARLGEPRRFRIKGMLSLELRKCPGCESRRLQLTATQRRGNNYTQIGQLLIKTEQPVNKAVV